jgi:Leucine-rich repeat (LRR) protein
LDAQVIKEGLHCIGKTFNNRSHAFLSLSVQERDLITINGLQNYKYLQNVDVSGNKLESLKPLGAIKHLLKLNASNNEIKYTFDFNPPANLEWVDYSGNKIVSIQAAHSNPYLKYLYLDNNNISRIDGLGTNKSLRVLSLNGN